MSSVGSDMLDARDIEGLRSEPLVSAKDGDGPESKAKLKRVYPPRAGAY